MRNLIASAVDWEGITGGRLSQNEYIYELGQGTLHKETGVLVIPMTLNFVLPYDDLLKIKAIVKNKLDFVNDVKFRFRYQGMIMNEDEIVGNYLPYLVRILEGSGAGFAKAIDESFFKIEDGEPKILSLKCNSKTGCEQLNGSVSGEFERILLKNFGLRYKVRFNFDEEEYLEKVDDFRQDLQEDKEKFMEENAQKAREAASRPKEDPAEKSNGFGNGNGGNRPGGRALNG